MKLKELFHDWDDGEGMPCQRQDECGIRVRAPLRELSRPGIEPVDQLLRARDVRCELDSCSRDAAPRAALSSCDPPIPPSLRLRSAVGELVEVVERVLRPYQPGVGPKLDASRYRTQDLLRHTGRLVFPSHPRPERLPVRR